jgi:hypothetical protein
MHWPPCPRVKIQCPPVLLNGLASLPESLKGISLICMGADAIFRQQILGQDLAADVAHLGILLPFVYLDGLL